MDNHRVKRVLVEFEQGDKVFELEIKNIEAPAGKFSLAVIGHEPSAKMTSSTEIQTRETAILDLHVVKRGSHLDDGVLYEIREVHGSGRE